MLKTSLKMLPLLLLAACNSAPKTYSKDCSSPLSHWGSEKEGIGHLRIVNAVTIQSDGSLLWNRHKISDETLTDFMGKVGDMNPEPQIVLEIASLADCKRVKSVRKIMDTASICKGPYSLCSEGANWRQWPDNLGDVSSSATESKRAPEAP